MRTKYISSLILTVKKDLSSLKTSLHLLRTNTKSHLLWSELSRWQSRKKWFPWALAVEQTGRTKKMIMVSLSLSDRSQKHWCLLSPKKTPRRQQIQLENERFYSKGHCEGNSHNVSHITLVTETFVNIDSCLLNASK